MWIALIKGKFYLKIKQEFRCKLLLFVTAHHGSCAAPQRLWFTKITVNAPCVKCVKNCCKL